MKELPEKVATGDTLEGVQLCPFGDWPNGGTVQKCDEVAFNKLVEKWREGGGREIICDFEHRFEDPSLTSDTSAAAWITNLAVNKGRGLVGDLKFTDAGAQAVTSRRLRFRRRRPPGPSALRGAHQQTCDSGRVRPQPRAPAGKRTC